MARQISEVHTFNKAQLEEIAKSHAKMAIIGGYYVGDFGEQTVEWKDDGSIVVTTKHNPER